VIVYDKPAKNGLHNVAFNFVADLIQQGKTAMDVFTSLIHGLKVKTFI